VVERNRRAVVVYVGVVLGARRVVRHVREAAGRRMRVLRSCEAMVVDVIAGSSNIEQVWV